MSHSEEFDDAICSECESPLHATGYCSNEGCGFASHLQNEPCGWRLNERRRAFGRLLRFEEGCIVVSFRTKKIYLPGSSHYRRVAKARTAVYFVTEEHALKLGFMKD